MKKLILSVATLILVASCSSSSTNETSTVEKTNTNEVVKNYIEKPSSITSPDIKQPIEDFKKEADKMEATKIEFNKENFKDVIKKASDFKTVVIVVEDHTIVKVTDFTNCSESGSWGACMPFGQGYIKKGKMNYEEGYINFIIGKPDTQKRTAYFFN